MHMVRGYYEAEREPKRRALMVWSFAVGVGVGMNFGLIAALWRLLW